MRFNGPPDVYVPERDDARLTTQYDRIFAYMKSGRWHTLEEIGAYTGQPVASVSAQLRHMRKPRFGSHTVERRSRSGPLYEYRLIVRVEEVVEKQIALL